MIECQNCKIIATQLAAAQKQLDRRSAFTPEEVSAEINRHITQREEARSAFREQVELRKADLLGYQAMFAQRDAAVAERDHARTVTLPPRRYLKDRTKGDDTYSDFSQGFDACLDEVERLNDIRMAVDRAKEQA